jgi:peptide deformylase
MAVRPLRYLGDPVLRTPCDRVTRFDDALASLIEDLLESVQEPGRAGLAANQIGVSLAAFSYNVDGQLGYLINPRIVDVDGDADGPEGCLSIPGLTALRHRAATATVAGVDMEQQPIVVSGTGELARCLQHETDHLEGRLFIDALASDERRRVMRELKDQLVPPMG